MTDEEFVKMADQFRRLDPDTKQLLRNIVIVDLQEQVNELTESCVTAAKKIYTCALILNRLGATPEMWREAKSETETCFAVEMAVGEKVVAAQAEAEDFREFIKAILQLGTTHQRKRRSSRKNGKKKAKG